MIVMWLRAALEVFVHAQTIWPAHAITVSLIVSSSYAGVDSLRVGSGERGCNLDVASTWAQILCIASGIWNDFFFVGEKNEVEL